jgi:hypothetical protein
MVNPVTGQLLDREENVEEEPMTMEEKEREAERLFVLFERCVSKPHYRPVLFRRVIG